MPASEANSSHADSVAERLSVVQHELTTHKSRQHRRERASLQQCSDALQTYKTQFHDIEERIALQASDHRAELNLLENFIREALFKVEQRLVGEADKQFDVLTEQATVVDEKVKALERVVLQGEGVVSEEEQIGQIRNEMAATVEAARQICEEEADEAKRDLSELTEPRLLQVRNLYEVAEMESKAVDRVIEDARAQLLALAAPPGQRLEAKEKQIAQGLREVRNMLQDQKQEREMAYAQLYDAMTHLSQEMIKKTEEDS